MQHLSSNPVRPVAPLEGRDAAPTPGASLDWKDLLTVAALALGLRLLFALLTGDTYDYDEFVILLLARALGGGAHLYRDVMFFHPPGALVIFAALRPLTDLWWPWSRVFTALVDTGTALLVARMAAQLFGRRSGVAAGVLYAANPLTLLSASRVGQDPLITGLGMAGLTLLVCKRSRGAAALAGVCLGLAIWIKYPALAFVPVYFLAAPRRSPLWLISATLAAGGAVLAFLPEAHQLWQQTVVFQRTRWSMPLPQRLETGLLYWLAVNPLALPSLFRVRCPPWLRVAFLLGGLFVLAPQVYYHYYVPVAAFGAVLSAPLAVRLATVSLRAVAVSIAVTGLWAAVIDLGGPSPLYVTAAHLSAIRPTVSLLDRAVPRGRRVLADRFEYAYLANRPAALFYFWNVGVLVDARYLQQRLGGVGAVVLSYGASSGYPQGFTRYLDARFPRTQTPSNTVWLTGG